MAIEVPESEATAPEHTTLRELGLLFLRLGATAFGGPAAHVAIMEDEVVRRRRWLSSERFLDLLSASQLIPGPNSTELALHIGWARRRLPGLLVAGAAFIGPAVLLTGLLAWAYLRYGALPEVGALLRGIKPVVVAIVAQALWRLAPRAAKSTSLALVGAGAAALAWIGVDEIVVLLGAAVVAALVHRLRSGAGPGSRPDLGRPALLLAVPACAAAATAPTLPGLFWVFLQIGGLLFGSGYVLLAFLQTEFVDQRGWLTQSQLLDAVAAGQVTPGPVFSTATFVGYLVQGPAGALVATLGIFLPAFVLVAVSGPLVPRLRASPIAGAVLNAVNAASLGLMLAVTVVLARGSLVDLPTAFIALASLALLLRFRINSSWLVLGGGAAGWALHTLG